MRGTGGVRNVIWMGIAVLLTALAFGALSAGPGKPKTVREAIVAWLKSLDSGQKGKAQHAFESEERFNWHFIPRERQGLSYKSMTPAQREAALDILRAATSDRGYRKIETIRSLEEVLKEIEKGSGPVRDPENYYFSVFGTPADKGVWGWRYEGHHISLQWTIIDGKVISSTPQMLGSNPAEVRQGPRSGTRALAAEEDLAYALLETLSDDQRQAAVLSETAPPDILTAASRKAAIQQDLGLSYAAMTPSQRSVLAELIREHASVQREDVAKKRWQALSKAGMETIKFAWMGSLKRGGPHYYRIQGKTFLIELDNTQNNANHIHAVWRDFEGDFGVDLLEQHYRTAPKEHGHR